MLLSGQNRLLAAGALFAAVAIPATFFATDASLAATISAEPLSAILTPDNAATDGAVSDDQTADATEIDAELECMAKVVLHEAGNQPREGQLAVAQLIQNRMESGRFADTICGVVNQPGQFFRTSSYEPRRDTPAWDSAVSVSREARRGASVDVAPGAMFFRAAYAAPTGFFRSRVRVATLGDHVFYR
jgi:N-acetylmuramoyl-L-alanine amidase